MIAVVQRVTEARVVVEGRVVGEIGAGLLVLVAVEKSDAAADVEWMANKLASIRMFRSADGEKHFELDVREAGGSILLVCQFTLAAQTKKGRRPSFEKAAAPEMGRKLFDELVKAIADLNIPTATGQFAADMKVSLVNDGPVTFIIESRSSAAPSTS